MLVVFNAEIGEMDDVADGRFQDDAGGVGNGVETPKNSASKYFDIFALSRFLTTSTFRRGALGNSSWRFSMMPLVIAVV